MKNLQKSLAAKIRWQKPGAKERMQKAAKKFWSRKGYRQNISKKVSKKAKLRWKEPEFRARIIAAMQLAGKKESRKKHCSEAAKRNWQNPAFRKRISSTSKARMLNAWSNPETRAKLLKTFRDPERNRRISASLRANSRGKYRESTLERIVVNWARERGVLVLKNDARHCAGAPDRIFMVHGGKPVLIEFKRPDGKGSLSKIQLHIIRKLQKAKYDVCVADNKEQAINYLQKRMRTVDTAQVPRKGN